MNVPTSRSVDFVDSHSGVNGQIGIANGGAGRSGCVARGGGEFAPGTLDGIGIAITLGAGHGERIGGDEFFKRSALAVNGDVGALRLGDLQEVASDTGQGDGLRRSRAFVGRRHSLQGEMIHNEEQGGAGQKSDKRAHKEIVA